jgi:hypothetical protein
MKMLKINSHIMPIMNDNCVMYFETHKIIIPVPFALRNEQYPAVRLSLFPELSSVTTETHGLHNIKTEAQYCRPGFMAG